MRSNKFDPSVLDYTWKAFGITKGGGGDTLNKDNMIAAMKKTGKSKAGSVKQTK